MVRWENHMVLCLPILFGQLTHNFTPFKHLVIHKENQNNNDISMRFIRLVQIMLFTLNRKYFLVKSTKTDF